MIQMSAGSSFFARVCPRSISAFPSALDSAKFNLHPNVVKEIFIIWLQRYCFFLTYARKKRPEDAFLNLQFTINNEHFSKGLTEFGTMF